MSLDIAFLDTPEARRRVELVLDENLRSLRARTDRLFVVLMICEWCFAIIAAVWISPFTWAGSEPRVHPHIWVATLLVGLVFALPMTMAFIAPGALLTRHLIAIGQALFSSLLIHLTGGRIESHFHIFGALALLAFYRDWTVLVSNSAVVALDHFIRGAFWPESVYGIPDAGQWRWLEHASWVVFEDIFLIYACYQSIRELRTIAERQVVLEATNDFIEEKVRLRTTELLASEERLQASERMIRAIVDAAADGIITIERARFFHVLQAELDRARQVTVCEVAKS